MATIAPTSNIPDRVAKPATPIIDEGDETVVSVPDAIVATPDVPFVITDDDESPDAVE